MNYQDFIVAKAAIAKSSGFEVADNEVNPILKPHQRAAVRWAIRGGRRAIFAAFGLGKSVMQLETLRIVTERCKGRGLIIAPLGVRQEFTRDAAMLGLSIRFIRRIEEADETGLYITNYETVRDGKLDPRKFQAVSLDEAAVLRGFGGTKTFREFMRLIAGDGGRGPTGTGRNNDEVLYRFVATATPSPNDYIELLAYSAFLGVMDVGGAKAQPLDSKVLTPNGWRPMGELKVGDAVVAVDGSATEVLGTYPQGEKEVFRVTFSDGASAECTADHLWLTRTLYERNNERRWRGRNPEGGREFATVKTTAEIAATLSVKGGTNHDVPLVAPVEFEPRAVDIHPWLLGALIGDACLRETSIVFSTADDWMLKRLSDLLPAGLSLRKTSCGSHDYGVTSTGKQGGSGPGSNPLLNSLRRYGLLGKRSFEKAIPEDYLFTSAEARLELLRGLMDTDGTAAERNGRTSFCSTSILLARQVVWLVRSLGGLATIRECDRCELTRNQAYLVEIRMAACPFSLPRKANRHRSPGARALARYITSVEPVGTKPAQCIAIAHPSRLYVTDDFVVTHNTRFFKRDSTKADKLTLHAHKEREFWLWVASWALFLERPSDLDPSFSDEGYDLPALTVRWHELPTDHDNAGEDMDGQARMFRNAALGLSEAAREKRDSLGDRIAKLSEIVAGEPDAHFLLWHDLEAERHAIERALPSSVSVYGSQDLEERERAIIAFSDGEIPILAAKPSIAGSGCNFQRFCHRAIYLGIGFKFNDFIQSVHRIRRYLQREECVIDLIYTEAEREIRHVLERKWRQHDKLVAAMTAIVREYGLSSAAMASTMTRGMSCERRVVEGPVYTIVNSDCVAETSRMESDSVGLIVSSLPFSNQYEYSPSYLDFGHTDDNAHFWRQMDFLTAELHRVLMPGRIAAIHVKDRIQPGGINGFGFQTVEPFSDETIAHFRRHGFAFIARKTIVTDVVRENNQTYRLGWTEQCKDGSRMGAGLPEYVLLFRKPQTDRQKGYADIPVEKSKPMVEDEDGTIRPWHQGGENRKIVPGTGYSRSRWQIDAHGYTRSSGNRLLAPSDFVGLAHEKIFKAFRAESLSEVYDHERHVAIAEELERAGTLPVTFMLLQPQSWHGDVWTDIARMRTLNTFQSQKGAEVHLCLARGSLVLTREYGYKPIEEVRIGDHVLTHKGRWRPVLAVQNTGDRDVVQLRGHGVSGLSLTPDHKVWAKDVARFARQADYARSAEPGWLEAGKAAGGYVNRKLPPVESSVVPASTWWVVGRWIADGHIDASGGAVISCALDERPELEAKLGEFGGNPYHQTGENCAQILLRDPGKVLRKILAGCGRGAAFKRLPPEAFTLPTEHATALLAGYLSGDGHFRPERQRWMASSISRTLLMGIAFLAQRVHGAIASVFPGRPERRGSIEGRDVAMRQDWILSFNLPGDRRKRPLLLEDGAWMRVRSAAPVGIQETWNLRVDEDESFTAEGMIVKNCPLQFDIVDRLIAQLSNPGDLVLDPFGGLMTVPYCAVKQRRRGYGIELAPTYWADGVAWVERAYQDVSTPTLFDFLDVVEGPDEVAEAVA